MVAAHDHAPAAFSVLRARAAKKPNSQFGLVLCFPHRSAKIEPFPTEPILAGNGGGWIDLGLVVMDRKRVRSAAVFA
jgi:hypothetical protein